MVTFGAKLFILFAFAQAVLPSLLAVGVGNDEKPLRQEIPKCRHTVVPPGQLSEHDGEIIDVFTPCHQKIICSAPREDPQHTIKQQVVPASMHFYKA